MNYNKILGVENGASHDAITKAFRASAMEIHPDHNNGLEAAEAFARIKEARDQLLADAEKTEAPHDATAIRNATASAVKATENAAYSTSQPMSPAADAPTAEEIAHIQELDRLAAQYAKASLLGRRHEPADVRRHRRQIATMNRRIDGKY